MKGRRREFILTIKCPGCGDEFVCRALPIRPAYSVRIDVLSGRLGHEIAIQPGGSEVPDLYAVGCACEQVTAPTV